MHQSQANRDEICFVDREHLNRGEADVGLGGQNGAVSFEMFAPNVASGAKKTNDIASRRVPLGNVRAFMPVAVETCERKVVNSSEAAVLPGNDVIDVKWQRVSRGRQVAVFATTLCPLPDLPRKFGIHDLSTAKGDPGLRLDHRKQIAHVQVAVEFCALFLGQFTGLRTFGQTSHAIDVALRESDRKRYSAAADDNSSPGICMSRAQIAGCRFGFSICVFVLAIFSLLQSGSILPHNRLTNDQKLVQNGGLGLGVPRNSALPARPLNSIARLAALGYLAGHSDFSTTRRRPPPKCKP